MKTRRPFAEFRNDERVFVEGGTYLGGGVQDALDAGFEKIISYEVSRGLFEKSKSRFLEDPRVNILFKPTQTMFDELQNVDERMFFWLDAHYSYLDTGFHETRCPILHELDAIGKHHIKTHTILVDDVRLFGTREFAGVTLNEVKKAILEINPAYQFTFADGYVQNDILVAMVPAESSS